MNLIDECLVVKLVGLIVHCVKNDEHDVQVSELSHWMWMVPFTGKGRTRMRLELRRRRVKSSIWSMSGFKGLKDLYMEMSSLI